MRFERSKIRSLSTPWGLGIRTANKQITSGRDINTEIGGCPTRAAIIDPKLKRTFSSLKNHRSFWLDFFFFTFSLPKMLFCETEGFSRLGGNYEAACGCAFCCWKRIGWESFPGTMLCKLKALNSVRIKVVDHTEELQLITFYGNWENVEARALYTQGVLVL